MQGIDTGAEKHIEQNCLMRNKNGTLSENTEGFFRRVALAAAAADARYDSDADTAATADGFLEMLSSLRFLPGALTLLNAGRPEGQLASCFVLPVEDSMESIFEAVKNAALIYKTGGNIGFSFSHLRKSGSDVNRSAAPAGGPVSFMRVFNAATEAVRQEAKAHGENIAALRIDHPDIEAFIHCHENVQGLENFHTAVIVTDEFIHAAEKGENFKLISPCTGKNAGSVKANELFVRLVDVMRRTGAPYVLFESMLDGAEAVAPCGEQPLAAYEVCNIGSINLTKMLECKNGKYSINYDVLSETIEFAVHFLDNIIDVNSYPFERISHVTRQTRKIGLGVMGFADILWYLDIPYNSEEATALADKLMQFINDESHKASLGLAEVRGAYPTHAQNGEAMRNKSVTAITAEKIPAKICACAEGIEPRKNVLVNGKLHPLLTERLLAADAYSIALEQKIILNGGTLAGVDGIPEAIKNVFICADEAQPNAQIKLEAAFQAHTDGAVSKTVQYAKSATALDIADGFLRAHDSGCMMFKVQLGDGVRVSDVAEKSRKRELEVKHPRQIPDITNDTTQRFRTPCGTLAITASYDAKGVCEVYTHGIDNCACDAFAKATQNLADLAVRSGVPIDSICAQLSCIKCSKCQNAAVMKQVSCPAAIAEVIEHAAVLSRSMNNPEAVKPEVKENTVDETHTKVEENKAVEKQAEAKAASKSAAVNLTDAKSKLASGVLPKYISGRRFASDTAKQIVHKKQEPQAEVAEPKQENDDKFFDIVLSDESVVVNKMPTALKGGDEETNVAPQAEKASTAAQSNQAKKPNLAQGIFDTLKIGSVKKPQKDVESKQPNEVANNVTDVKPIETDEKVCAICGGKTKRIGNKIVCTECGFTRTKRDI